MWSFLYRLSITFTAFFVLCTRLSGKCESALMKLLLLLILLSLLEVLSQIAIRSMSEKTIC